MWRPNQCGLAKVRVIELFGPSSGGKTSLARRLVAVGGARAFVFTKDRLLALVGLSWLPAGLARTLVGDLLTLVALPTTWRAAHRYYAFSARVAFARSFSASFWLRLNILRNAWKGAALGLLAPRLARPGEVLLLDEGPLQTAHYLLVHATSEPRIELLEEFLRTVPLPESAAYFRLDEDELVRRTLRRGHPRVPAGQPNAVRSFVRNALAVLDRIADEPRVRRRLIGAEVLAEAACTGRGRTRERRLPAANVMVGGPRDREASSAS